MSKPKSDPLPHRQYRACVARPIIKRTSARLERIALRQLTDAKRSITYPSPSTVAARFAMFVAPRLNQISEAA